MEHLAAAIQAATDQRERAIAALSLIQALVISKRSSEAVDVLSRALGEVAGADRELASRLEGRLIWAASQDLSTRPLVAKRALKLAAQVQGGTAAERVLLAHLAFDMAMANLPAWEVAETAARALGGGLLVAEETADSPAVVDAILTLVHADRMEDADAQYARAVKEARRRGSVLGFAQTLCFRADAAYRRGALSDAEADARQSMETAAAHGLDLLLPYAAEFLVETLHERGDLDEAEDLLLGQEQNLDVPDSLHANRLLYMRARLRLSRGNAEEALSDLLACGRWLDAWGARNPAMVPWRSTAAMAYAALGDRSEATRRVEEEVVLAREFGAPRALGIALRAAGLVAGGEEGLALLREAAVVLAGSPSILEHARALIDLGAATRRAGHRSVAKEHLRQGMGLAHRCGTTPLADLARQELLAAGARPRRPVIRGVEALTPSERRVAEMAAGGLSNREIAQALFVTMRTVEVHLTHGYQKLGIHSRGELPPPTEFRQAAGAAVVGVTP